MRHPVAPPIQAICICICGQLWTIEVCGQFSPAGSAGVPPAVSPAWEVRPPVAPRLQAICIWKKGDRPQNDPRPSSPLCPLLGDAASCRMERGLQSWEVRHPAAPWRLGSTRDGANGETDFSTFLGLTDWMEIGNCCVRSAGCRLTENKREFETIEPKHRYLHGSRSLRIVRTFARMARCKRSAQCAPLAVF